MKLLRVLALAGVVLARALSSSAQQSVDYGSISGRVTDPSGAVIAGAGVTARHVATNLSTAAVTDRDGRFRFPSLRIGAYEIAVRQQGFQHATLPLTLSAGSAFELPVTLTVAGIDAAVTVSAEATVLDAARSQIAATVFESEVRALPLNGRNFLELGLLAPGVSPTNVPSTQMFPETSAVPGVSLSVSSQRNLSNNFIVDGLSANDDAAALSGIAYGLDAVEQFQVVTSGAQADLGRALGGYVNVVTRSGANVLAGTAYDFLRDDRLNAANSLSGTRLPMDQMQFGGSVGGPIAANRTFYFANAERRQLDQSGLVTVAAASAAAVNARLAAAGYRGPAVATGLYRSPMDTTTVLAKADHQQGGRHRLSLRYSLYDVGARNARGAGGLNAPSAAASLDSRDQNLALGSTLTVTSHTVLETRAQIAHGDLGAPPVDPTGPFVSIAGVASFGTSSGSPTRRVNRMYQLVNNLSHQAGAHAVKAGVDFLFNDDRIVYPRAIRGSYSFPSLAAFLAGTYNNSGFTQTFGASEVSQANPNLGVYLQDEWKVSPRVTLNAGLRYDMQFLETIRTDTGNIAPRFGVAWSPFEARRTLVRGSAGLFYDRVPLRAVANALLSAGNTTDVDNLRQIAVSLSPAQAGAPVFPNILSGVVPSVTLVNLTTMDRDLQNAYSRQASVEIEQHLGREATLSAGYQYLRGRNLLMSVNQNVPTCAASGSNNGCRPNAGYANNHRYSSAGDSNYHGLHVTFVQRPVRWGHYRISYTLSKSMNNVGEFFFSSPIDAFDLSKDWGRSDDDQRHRLVVNGTLQAPEGRGPGVLQRLLRGFQFGGMLQAYSALPFNITSGVTTIQGTAGRPIVNGQFIRRNAGTGSDFFRLSLRVSRTFRVTGRLEAQGLVEGFNLTGHHNVLARNTNFGAGSYPASPLPAFGQVTAVGDPRTLQFGIRIRF